MPPFIAFDTYNSIWNLSVPSDVSTAHSPFVVTHDGNNEVFVEATPTATEGSNINNPIVIDANPVIVPNDESHANILSSSSPPVDTPSSSFSLFPSPPPSPPTTPLNRPVVTTSPPEIRRTVPRRVAINERFEQEAAETILGRRRRDVGLEEEDLSSEDSYDAFSDDEDDDDPQTAPLTPLAVTTFRQFLDDNYEELWKQFGHIKRRCKRRRMYMPSNGIYTNFWLYAKFIYDNFASEH